MASTKGPRLVSKGFPISLLVLSILLLLVTLIIAIANTIGPISDLRDYNLAKAAIEEYQSSAGSNPTTRSFLDGSDGYAPGYGEGYGYGSVAGSDGSGYSNQDLESTLQNLNRARTYVLMQVIWGSANATMCLFMAFGIVIYSLDLARKLGKRKTSERDVDLAKGLDGRQRGYKRYVWEMFLTSWLLWIFGFPFGVIAFLLSLDVIPGVESSSAVNFIFFLVFFILSVPYQITLTIYWVRVRNKVRRAVEQSHGEGSGDGLGELTALGVGAPTNENTTPLRMDDEHGHLTEFPMRQAYSTSHPYAATGMQWANADLRSHRLYEGASEDMGMGANQGHARSSSRNDPDSLFLRGQRHQYVSVGTGSEQQQGQVGALSDPWTSDQIEYGYALSPEPTTHPMLHHGVQAHHNPAYDPIAYESHRNPHGEAEDGRSAAAYGKGVGSGRVGGYPSPVAYDYYDRNTNATQHQRQARPLSMPRRGTAHRAGHSVGAR
ncbi:hypothetical protein IE53DRAFT_385115 [Violaceomyces palustris]|uniref:Uncharacterized protein n=1 Tax=Violaceomyces palustris TaxID=1673888 RepID=A0ACD0P2W1_9BASI|nr:hypothetical protein IE53DRAFT_385115 [Violaceomyces palustris]